VVKQPDNWITFHDKVTCMSTRKAYDGNHQNMKRNKQMSQLAGENFLMNVALNNCLTNEELKKLYRVNEWTDLGFRKEHLETALQTLLENR